MTHKEAMKVLGCSWSTLSRYVKSGKIRTSQYEIRGRMGKRNYWDEDVYAMVGRKVQKGNEVVAYFRLNKNNKDSREKMKEQRKMVKMWCSARGITIDREIVDWAYGVDFSEKRRPGYHEILRLIAGKKLDAIVVECRDRLARFNWESIEAMCKYYGVHLLVVNEGITDEYYQNEQTEDIARLLERAKVERIKG